MVRNWILYSSQMRLSRASGCFFLARADIGGLRGRPDTPFELDIDQRRISAPRAALRCASLRAQKQAMIIRLKTVKLSASSPFANLPCRRQVKTRQPDSQFGSQSACAVPTVPLVLSTFLSSSSSLAGSRTDSDRLMHLLAREQTLSPHDASTAVGSSRSSTSSSWSSSSNSSSSSSSRDCPTSLSPHQLTHSTARHAALPRTPYARDDSHSQRRSSTCSPFMPRAAFPQDDDKGDDKDRRNVTAHTIVKLLAGHGRSATTGRPLPSLRQPTGSHSSSSSSSVSSSSWLPSLPKLLIPSRRSGHPVPLSTSAFAAQTPTTSGSGSPIGLSPAARPLAVPPPAAPVTSGSSAATATVGGGGPVAVSSGPKRGRPATLCKVANNSRKRQKDELTRLRAQVQELQRELEHVRLRMPRQSCAMMLRAAEERRERGQSLQSSSVAGALTAAAATSGSFVDSARESAPGFSRLLVVPVWERMAQHQKEEKSKAEMENLRLKGLIQEQLKISKGLEKLLRKRCKSSMSSGSDAETQAAVLGVKRLCTSETQESAVYASLASGLEARLAELDAVFEKGGLTREKQEVQEAQMILDERRGPVMEVKDAKILPFDVRACAAAVWQSMKVESEATVVEGATCDTLYFKSRMPLRQHRAPEVELIVRCVMRRAVDEVSGRVVFVWESVAECPDRLPFMSCSAKGLEIRDCGWGQLEAVRTSNGEQSSILKLCSYLMPQLCGVSAEQSRQQIPGLAELVAPYYRGLWSQRQRNVENKLMNGAISAKNNPAALNVVLKQEAAW